MCVRVAIDLDLFQIISSAEHTTAADLAIATGAQQELIGTTKVQENHVMLTLHSPAYARSLRQWVCLGNRPPLLQPQPDHAGDDSALLRGEHHTCVRHPYCLSSVAYCCSYDQGLPSIASLPRYFQRFGYASPDDYNYGPFQFGHKTDMESYAYWLTKPEVIDNFDTFMNGGKLGNQRRWTGL